MLNQVGTAELKATVFGSTAHVLFIDVETRSPLNLKDVGAHQYARDRRTEIICLGFACDDEGPQTWVPGSVIPQEFTEASRNPNWTIVAHTANFELAITRSILEPRFSFPSIPLMQWRCTQAAALALGLPARLDKLAEALELAHRKDISGQRLMMMMARPRRAHKDQDATQTFYFCDNDRLQRLFAYCCEDVRVTREIANRLPPLLQSEHAIWCLDHTINARGFHLDRTLAETAAKLAAIAAPEIDQELAEVTNRAVTGISQIARLQAWLQEQGCAVESLNKKAVATALMKTELPHHVQRALELRQDGGQAAVKKITTLLNRAGSDGRVRGAFVYHKAGTGRWAGAGPQPQNLKKAEIGDIDAAITAISTGNHDHVRSLYPRVLSLLGDLSRSFICAAPGHVLIGADFSSIESRVLAWIAGEEWKLDAYRRFDATGDLRDEPYCETACRIFRVPSGSYTKDSPERGVGKVCDLAFGYMGGLGAWRKFEPDRFTDDEVKKFCSEWRATHPAIKRFWYSIDRAALTAVRERGCVVRCGPIAFKNSGAFLLLKLPSGRKLSYPQPRPQPRAVGDEKRQHVVFADNAAGQFKDCRNGAGAYGGLWVENVVSGIARDLLAEAMLRIEAAGYPIVLHVHDEIVAEVPIGFGSPDEFTHLMTRKPAWALELPIAATAWTGARYTK
jgi:DNA polymerase bacteriophage-type